MSGYGGGGGRGRGGGDHAGGCKIFVGGLDDETRKTDLEDLFRTIGPVASIWIARKPPGFAFVEFEDPRDAEDACKDMDGREILGRRIRCEMARAPTRARVVAPRLTQPL
eukprot:736859_1